jgi:hypothetical protein
MTRTLLVNVPTAWPCAPPSCRDRASSSSRARRPIVPTTADGPGCPRRASPVLCVPRPAPRVCRKGRVAARLTSRQRYEDLHAGGVRIRLERVYEINRNGCTDCSGNLQRSWRKRSFGKYSCPRPISPDWCRTPLKGWVETIARQSSQPSKSGASHHRDAENKV